ncbi:hypothetical protein SOPP22_12530 [Shewanella sp. OPT22]|nr:hypothetical protein SOPP22_12530 [Shewanella sp. OPT22]
MKLRLFVIFSILLSCSALAEKCKLEYLTELEYTDIECQFYLGTEAYRNQVYTVAAAHWKYVLQSPTKYSDDDQIKAMALSTVTFLMYQGLGGKQDRAKAVKIWEEAARKGDFEARRHLGFAYSDSNFGGKNLIKALGWYESIFLLAPENGDIDNVKEDVYQDAIEERFKLKSMLSKEELKKSLKFAKSTL